MIMPVWLERGIFGLLILFALSSTLSIGANSIALYAGLLLILISLRFAKPSINREAIPLIKLLALFFAALIITSLFSQSPQYSLSRTLAVFTRTIPFFLAALYIRSRTQIIVILTVLALSLLISDMFLFWQHLSGVFRPPAFTGNPIVFASMLALLMPILLVVGKKGGFPKQANGFLLFVFIVSLEALFLTLARGAWLAAGVVIILYVLTIYRKSFRKMLAALLVFAILFGFASLDAFFLERVTSIYDFSDQSNLERLAIWDGAIRMFRDYPLTGVGLGKFYDMMELKYLSLMTRAPEAHIHAHSNIFSFLAETGVLGLGAFLSLYLYILYSNLVAYLRNPNVVWPLAAFLVTIAFLVHGLTEYNFGHLPVLRLYWFIMGLCYAGVTLSPK